MADHELQNLMDGVGWSSPSDENHQYRIFKWMQEATAEIKRLQNEVESLSRTLASRTEHLV